MARKVHILVVGMLIIANTVISGFLKSVAAPKKMELWVVGLVVGTGQINH